MWAWMPELLQADDVMDPWEFYEILCDFLDVGLNLTEHNFNSSAFDNTTTHPSIVVATLTETIVDPGITATSDFIGANGTRCDGIAYWKSIASKSYTSRGGHVLCIGQVQFGIDVLGIEMDKVDVLLAIDGNPEKGSGPSKVYSDGVAHVTMEWIFFPTPGEHVYSIVLQTPNNSKAHYYGTMLGLLEFRA